MISNIWNSYPGYSIDAGDYDNDGDYDLLCSLIHDNPKNADTTFIFKNINAALDESQVRDFLS